MIICGSYFGDLTKTTGWQTLSIPKNKSDEFNSSMINQKKN